MPSLPNDPSEDKTTYRSLRMRILHSGLLRSTQDVRKRYIRTRGGTEIIR